MFGHPQRCWEGVLLYEDLQGASVVPSTLCGTSGGQDIDEGIQTEIIGVENGVTIGEGGRLHLVEREAIGVVQCFDGDGFMNIQKRWK